MPRTAQNSPTRPPEVVWARDVDSVPRSDDEAFWWPRDASYRRLVVAAVAADQLDALPVPEYDELPPEGVVYLGGEWVEVLDLATRERVRVRRAQCGLGPCCCGWQWWPAARTEPLPAPDWYDRAELYQDDPDAVLDPRFVAGLGGAGD